MRHYLYGAAAAAASACLFAPSAASAQQWTPGSELYGQQVQVVTANGETNTLSFQPDGTLSVYSTNGQSAQGNWGVQGNQICAAIGGGRECWPYQAPFRAQQSVMLTSDCGASSRWTAMGVNEPPVQRRAGERG